ncbi:DUF397 domain-containing protein [Actinomadura nitritigenes]|uniref:DUF397 domain-containing protein n=1 Tax=Actinomadura nitritigenes TaxID=134602 RepID=A0ABS3RE25_9ACTN|nr:DUF397 domain-containing protein [Actinomadura nitritigenes]MBO2444479.1 DUF397 domain-containing protein [Actinomadura nitritigenes]
MRDIEGPLDLADAVWRKGLRSNSSGNCVEVTFLRSHVWIRDSRAPLGPVMVLSPRGWARFAGAVKCGAHDPA